MRAVLVATITMKNHFFREASAYNAILSASQTWVLFATEPNDLMPVQDNSQLARALLEALLFLRVNVCDRHTIISKVYLIRTVSGK